MTIGCPDEPQPEARPPRERDVLAHQRGREQRHEHGLQADDEGDRARGPRGSIAR